MDTQIRASNAAAVVSEAVPRHQVKGAEARPIPAEKPAAPQEREITREQLETATQKIQKFVEASTSELQFSIDEVSGARVVRVLDQNTKEVIRQIPSQEVIDMANALDRLQGLLLKQKA